MGIGSFGRVRVFEDFLGSNTATAMGTTALAIGNIAYVSVNEGTFAPTVDEPGGILAITTDTADNDNCALYAGPFKPADGGVVMEARFKTADITTVAIFCGFSETLDATTPVMPAEYDTTTLTINGSGGVAGLLWDPDGTANDWRVACGDAGANATDLATTGGTLSKNDAVNDEWDVVRVEIDVNGDAKVWHDGVLIDDVAACVTAGDIQHACLVFENRSDAATTSEVDYFYAEGGRDWTV
jgi:hypothetical protein